MIPDDIDGRLLNAVQEQIPLVDRPFEALGRQLGLSEQQVIARLAAQKGDRARPGLIRQISAIFDSRALGYESCLVAAQIDPSRIEAAAGVISAHPGVSHNYQRNHAYNLWYTVTIPPDSRLGLAATVDALHALSGAAVTRLMPALRMYKIGVKFDMSDDAPPARDVPAGKSRGADAPAGSRSSAGAAPPAAPSPALVRVLQQDLPIVSRPFDAWAEAAGVSTTELLSAAQAYLDTGVMRRFSAVLRHRQAGFSANAMGCWIVPDERADAFGETAATFSAVSHCYRRPTYEDWPYSIFTMVHAQTPEQCERVLREIAEATGTNGFLPLYSTREFKKQRVRYFTGDIARWESEFAQLATPSGS